MTSGVGVRAMTAHAPSMSLEPGVRAAVSFDSIL
jgi:hypothetical protein